MGNVEQIVDNHVALCSLYVTNKTFACEQPFLQALSQRQLFVTAR